MKCVYCGEEFSQLSTNQKYCSESCGRRYRREHNAKERWPSVTFACAQCGKTIVTEAGTDKRTRFCSASCEKKFWRHPHWETPATRMNFRSIEAYEAYERRTNE